MSEHAPDHPVTRHRGAGPPLVNMSRRPEIGHSRAELSMSTTGDPLRGLSPTACRQKPVRAPLMEAALTRVNNPATPVHVIKAEEDLLRNLLDQMHWNALVLMTLDQAQQVLPKDLENHADMGAVRTFVSEMIEK